jgi:hypothetical protein
MAHSEVKKRPVSRMKGRGQRSSNLSVKLEQGG